MSRAAEQRRQTEIKILTELREIGLGNLEVTAYPSGVVVNDGRHMWTAKPGDVMTGIRKVKAGLVAAGRGLLAHERLCSVTPYLARGDASARARHGRCVKAWRRDNPGRSGSWI